MMMSELVTEKKSITEDDFGALFNVSCEKFPAVFFEKLHNVDTCYMFANKNELEEYIFNVLKLIHSNNIQRTLEQYLQTWEKGWSENLSFLSQKSVPVVEALKPKYFRDSRFLRFNKELIVSDNLSLEYDLFVLSRYIIFSKYLCEYENIYEFGCGSCQNLLMLSEMFPSKKICGLDWVEPSVKIAKKLSETLDRNIEGFIFDMLNPSPDIVLKPNSAVITIHSLEQLGQRHDKLLSFIIAARPDIVINYEPILEFYDEDNLLDYLAILYSRKRNYLSGYFTALRELEKQNKIEILQAYRPYLGGIIHESSLIIWRPL